MSGWMPCPYCGRLMLATAKTCGNYCRWDELVTPQGEATSRSSGGKPKKGQVICRK